MDDRLNGFLESFRQLVDLARRHRPESGLTPIGQVVQEHLGTDIRQLPTVTEVIADHRMVDADLALDVLGGAGRVVGISGGRSRRAEDFAEMLANPYQLFEPGPVDYQEVASGPGAQRPIVAFGIRLFHFDDTPVAALQRIADPRFGIDKGGIDLLAADPAVTGRLLVQLRKVMRERSVLRGQVITFTVGDFEERAQGARFVLRPGVEASDVILPEGVLRRVVDHVVGIGEHRAELVAAGRHLKRGILLYGPPGTGKTHTVRHLITRSTEATVVLLTGPAIKLIGEATELARALQPALVVLEDIDLVAQDRESYGPQPLLFTVLDALDGLDGDADVAFVMTTNRVELLERALAERPGRVDLAVEIGLPGRDERARLLRLYADGLPISGTALDRAADRTDQTTASFAKELIRRAVLRALGAGHEVSDEDLAASLHELMSDREALTRAMLGGSRFSAEDPDPSVST